MLAALSENWSFLFIVLVINNGNISCMRGILRDMLVGNRNGKAERRIYKKQTLRQRISLRYIFPYLKRYQQAYVLWHRRYVVQCAILVPPIRFTSLTDISEIRGRFRPAFWIGCIIIRIICSAMRRGMPCITTTRPLF